MFSSLSRLLFAIRKLLMLMAIVFSLMPREASAGLEPGPGNSWLAVASRTNASDAIALARQYAGQFPTVVVFQSSNGNFGVTLGWINKDEGQGLLQSLISQGAVPADSYFTAGARFVRAVWSANGSHTYSARDLYASTRIGNFARSVDPAPQPPINDAPVVAEKMAPRDGFVSGVESTTDQYLALRKGPGSGFEEVARMRENTGLVVTGTKGGWFEVRLSNGMRGWAFGKYVQFGSGQQVAKVSPPKEVPVIGPQKGVEPAKTSEPATAPDAKIDETTSLADKENPGVNTIEPQKPIADQKRVALVLGNSAYQNATELPNPKNDAAAISKKLAGLGFSVVSGLDGSKVDMEKSIREFVKQLEGADVALLFYAGHGMQVNGVNYMIPVDAKLEESTALDFETISMTAILNFMNAEGRISIVLLDACRDNPLARKFSRSLGKSRSSLIGRGLARPDVGNGEVLIGFATSPGETAADGEGTNSPFTTALIKHMDAKALDIELMMKRVKRDVYEATEEEQEPFVESGLRQEFFFNPQ